MSNTIISKDKFGRLFRVYKGCVSRGFEPPVLHLSLAIKELTKHHYALAVYRLKDANDNLYSYTQSDIESIASYAKFSSYIIEQVIDTIGEKL